GTAVRAASGARPQFVACAICPIGTAHARIAAAQPGDLGAAGHAVAGLPGEPRIVSAAGVTRDEAPGLSIENPSAFDPSDRRLRVALVGAPGGSPNAILDAVRWFKTRAPGAVRRQWTVSALPSAAFDEADTLSLARRGTFQTPDLIVTVGTVPLEIAAPIESIAVDDAAAAFQKLLAAPRERSPLHATVAARVARDPLAIARLLARKYPETPAISYIPALAW